MGGLSLSLFDLLSISSLILPISGVKRESEREKEILPYQDSPGFVFGISYDGLQFAHSLRRDVLYTAKVFVERWEAECRQSFVQDFKCASQRTKKIRKEKVVNYHNIVGMMMRVTRITFLRVSVLFSFSRQVWAIKS